MKREKIDGRWFGLMVLAGLSVATCGWTSRQNPGDTDRTQSATAFVDGFGDVDVPAFNAALDPDVRAYSAHVTTLGNPFFEGRAPGTNGNRVAAQYIEFWFRYFDLEPAFPEYDSEGQPIGDPDRWVSYRQPFSVPGSVSATRELLSYTTGDGAEVSLKAGAEFNAMGVGDGLVTAPLSFVGYGIADGPEGYDSFGDVDLTGTIAVVLRFEPSGPDGLSLWNDGDKGWSMHASIDTKLLEAAQRGAAGIILINAPGTHDSRTNQIFSASQSSWRKTGIPVVHMSVEAGDALLVGAGGKGLSEFKAMADAPDATSTFLDEKVQVTINTEIDDGRNWTDNVGGVLRGRGELADEWIIIGGHYDHLGYGSFGSMGGRTTRGIIHPGADDNASGTSAVLLLAQRLSKAYREMGPDAQARSILFMGFSAEESGLVGSRHYTRHATLGADVVNIMLNLDMVGRMRKHKLEVSGIGTAKGLADMVKPYFERSGLTVRSQVGGSGPSDHSSFFSVGIPVLFFFTGLHPDYHRPADVASLVNMAGAVRIVDLAQELTLAFAEMPEPLEYVRVRSGRFRLDLLDADEEEIANLDETDEGHEAEPAPGARIRVRLGIMPNYEDSDADGVLLDGVSPESPAQKAGLAAGDRIVSWNGKKIKDIQGLMAELSGHSPGDVVKIGVQRGGTAVELSATLEASGG